MRLKNMFLRLTCILLACGVTFAQPAQQYSQHGVSRFLRDAHTPDPSYSAAEVRKMMRDATSSDDYARLAEYFDFRALQYEQKTRDHVKDLQGLLALRYHSRFYPTQVQYARDLVKRDRAKAEKFSTQAGAYREHANGITQTE